MLPFHKDYQFGELHARNLTPAYLSNEADVVHFDVASLSRVVMLTLVLLCVLTGS
jgi:hypothetical protein